MRSCRFTGTPAPGGARSGFLRARHGSYCLIRAFPLVLALWRSVPESPSIDTRGGRVETRRHDRRPYSLPTSIGARGFFQDPPRLSNTFDADPSWARRWRAWSRDPRALLDRSGARSARRRRGRSRPGPRRRRRSLRATSPSMPGDAGSTRSVVSPAWPRCSTRPRDGDWPRPVRGTAGPLARAPPVRAPPLFAPSSAICDLSPGHDRRRGAHAARARRPISPRTRCRS